MNLLVVFPSVSLPAPLQSQELVPLFQGVKVACWALCSSQSCAVPLGA